VPLPPTNVAAYDGQSQGYPSGTAAIKWNAATNAETYQVWNNTVNNSATATLKTTVSHHVLYVNVPCALGLNYFWLKACNASGCSAFSSVASCTVT
jgi:hypothetical protein